MRPTAGAPVPRPSSSRSCIAQFRVVVDSTIVNVALPDIQNDLHLSQGGLSWIINGYSLTFAGFLLFGGRAADLWGRRRVFQVGIALFTAMSLLGGLSVNGTELVSAMTTQKKIAP